MATETDEFSPPFTPELLERLRALDRRCHLGFNRYLGDSKDSDVPRQLDRVWCVTIHLRIGMAHETVRGICSALKDATTQAVEEADARGWHLPRAEQRTSAARTGVLQHPRPLP